MQIVFPRTERGSTFYFRAYQSAVQNDLWAALTKQAHQDKVLDRDVTVKQIMDTWTLLTGFPVVTVTRNYDNDGAVISQVFTIFASAIT